ncbi:GbsR/MarR family transcriptional regulator [Anditalea andensis]|uniref:HTH marR-type domain-containing protein n=1 Tax=Anditalea andensis TaxID=1048983 RepID=A0A074KW07_9BACT|nr:hypothetical protein [Anditalea andensis]KEO74141.1 hypothetical protein EL17_08350 [Anditalea andensis]
MQLTDKQREIIEIIGVFQEQNGLQPALGRILGLLMVADLAEATFDEIVENLSLSKSAVSSALTLLQTQNKIEYTTKPGERKRYFRLKRSNWEKELKKGINSGLQFSEILDKVLAIRNDQNPDFNRHLENIRDFMTFLQKEIPILIDKYLEQQKNDHRK